MPRGDPQAPVPPRRAATPSIWIILAVPPLFWAGNFVIGRALHADIHPLALTFWRWVVAAAVLLPFTITDAWRRRATLRRHWPLLVVLCLSGIVAFQYVVYQGLQTTTAINGVLIIATIPVAIPITAFLLDGTTISARQALGIAISFAGVAIVILKGDVRFAEGLRFLAGDLWVCLAVPAWSIYSVLIRRRPNDLPPLTLLFVTVVLGIVLLAPGYALEQSVLGGFQPTVQTLAAIGYVGVFASVIAFACWNHGVAAVGAAKAGLFIHLMPVFAAILAVLFLGEQLHQFHVIGVIAIALGIWCSSTARR
ncbi:MAG: DMT family transporter [Rhodospirillales bacterium]|nr:DMT family transporter [Rhodospirillales bacterium]